MFETVGSPWMWGGFLVLIVAMLALDLGVLHRKPHAVGTREALTWSVVWVSAALLFNVGVYFWFGPQRAVEFLTGYLIEKALSVDNIFIFLVIFSYFAVPAEYQHRVLFWGVLGAVVFRAIFVVLGAALLQTFHWIIWVFGGFLILTGIKILMQKNEEVHPERNPLIRLFRRFVPTVSEYHGARFWITQNGRRYATPLLLVLLTVEVTDIIFAVDSIPAIFAVTSDPFIVFTSNIFAILGLRALYFLLAGVVDRFQYLKVGLGLVLAFVGTKMVISEWYKIPAGVSLVIVVSILAASVIVSLLKPPAEAPLPESAHAGEEDALPEEQHLPAA